MNQNGILWICCLSCHFHLNTPANLFLCHDFLAMSQNYLPHNLDNIIPMSRGFPGDRGLPCGVEDTVNINHGKIFRPQFPWESLTWLTFTASPINRKLIMRGIWFVEISVPRVFPGNFLLPQYQPILSRPPTPPCKWLPRLQDSREILKKKESEKEELPLLLHTVVPIPSS